eukprot:5228808-Prymnesium_polylepis.2
MDRVGEAACARTHLVARPRLDLRHRQALPAAVAAENDVQHDLLRLRPNEHQVLLRLALARRHRQVRARLVQPARAVLGVRLAVHVPLDSRPRCHDLAALVQLEDLALLDLALVELGAQLVELREVGDTVVLRVDAVQLAAPHRPLSI